MSKELEKEFGNQPLEIKPTRFNSIEEAIEDIKAGKIVIVVDDEDRENEGDFVCAAQHVNPEIINFMATHGRGLICSPITEERAIELDLDMMAKHNTAHLNTAFTVSVDLNGHGCTTGISAHDRAVGINALADKNFTAIDFARPGHIFPLIAKEGGVLRRTGHTEAAIDLVKLAGLEPVGVLVEILNTDGSMARVPQLRALARIHGMKLITIADLVAYRMKNERLVKKISSKKYNTSSGEVDVHLFEQITTGDIHMAVQYGNWHKDDEVPVRVHSRTNIDYLIHAMFREEEPGITKAMQKLQSLDKGLLLYMRHEDKELPLQSQIEKSQPGNHIESSGLQRDIGIGAQIISEMGIEKIILLTNHPKRPIGLDGYGLTIVDVMPY
jgi:3,4-dihydroxy 2-butanone 4-phosphate synthase/GTP cyclohydrolase II